MDLSQTFSLQSGWMSRGLDPGFWGDGSEGKEYFGNMGDLALIPGSGRCPGEGNGCSLRHYCLENPMERGVWWIPWGHKELDMTEWLTLLLFLFFWGDNHRITNILPKAKVLISSLSFSPLYTHTLIAITNQNYVLWEHRLTLKWLFYLDTFSYIYSFNHSYILFPNTPLITYHT